MSERQHMQLFPNLVDCITDLLYVGCRACNTPQFLRVLGFTHVVQISASPPPDQYKPTSNHLYLQLEDDEDADLMSVFHPFMNFVDQCDAKRGDRVLVHCGAGVSRSISLVVAYLILRESMTFDDAWHVVSSARPVAQPNEGFLTQLKTLVPGTYMDTAKQTWIQSEQSLSQSSDHLPMKKMLKELAASTEEQSTVSVVTDALLLTVHTDSTQHIVKSDAVTTIRSENEHWPHCFDDLDNPRKRQKKDPGEPRVFKDNTN